MYDICICLRYYASDGFIIKDDRIVDRATLEERANTQRANLKNNRTSSMSR